MADAEKKLSQQMVQQEQKYYAPTGRIPYYDMVIDHGEGAMLYDVDGNGYIDLLASASATNVGHCHPRVVDAITQQAQKLIHYTPAYMYHTPEIELVQKLCEIAPGDSPKKVVFGNSGSDANDAIIKFARAYTGRQYMVSFRRLSRLNVRLAHAFRHQPEHASQDGALAARRVSHSVSRRLP